MKVIALLFVMLCVGCSPSISMPSLTNPTPNILTKDTQVVVSPGVVATLDRGTHVQTEAEDKPSVEATLAQSIKTTVGGKEVDLPKNTKIILPPNTFLIIKDSATIRLEESSDITLKKGTIVTMSKINWYAILFYLIAIGGLVYYFFFIRNQDKDANNDGFVDQPKRKQKNV
jgi:hypothetical protein